jgi:tyrosyl-tRNA synthetase
MPGLVPGIHALAAAKQDVDGRDKPGHDERLGMALAIRNMSTFKSDFLHVLSSRGFIHQISEPEALDARAKSGRVTAYIGFDCTAPSLHVGSLLPIMMLYWMQQTGHRPIALMGGGTTRVGDPSGKDESRKLLTDAMIEQNLKGIRTIFGGRPTPSWPTTPTG